MKKIISILVITFSISFIGCTAGGGAVDQSKEFIVSFKEVAKEYNDNPSKENLKKVMDLVKNTNIKLTEEDKKVVKEGLDQIEKNIFISSSEVKEYWKNNKSDILDSVQIKAKNGIDKIVEWIKKYF